jgi:hypothetical protein
VPEESELERAIRRVVSRVLVEPISRDLLERMKAYGSPEKFLVWWLHGMGQTDYQAYARSLNNREIADSLDYNSAYAKTDMARAIMEEASRRLRDGGETQYVLPVPPHNPPLKAETVPD